MIKTVHFKVLLLAASAAFLFPAVAFAYDCDPDEPETVRACLQTADGMWLHPMRGPQRLPGIFQLSSVAFDLLTPEEIKKICDEFKKHDSINDQWLEDAKKGLQGLSISNDLNARAQTAAYLQNILAGTWGDSWWWDPDGDSKNDFPMATMDFFLPQLGQDRERKIADVFQIPYGDSAGFDSRQGELFKLVTAVRARAQERLDKKIPQEEKKDEDENKPESMRAYMEKKLLELKLAKNPEEAKKLVDGFFREGGEPAAFIRVKLRQKKIAEGATPKKADDVANTWYTKQPKVIVAKKGLFMDLDGDGKFLVIKPPKHGKDYKPDIHSPITLDKGEDGKPIFEVKGTKQTGTFGKGGKHEKNFSIEGTEPLFQRLELRLGLLPSGTTTQHAPQYAAEVYGVMKMDKGEKLIKLARMGLGEQMIGADKKLTYSRQVEFTKGSASEIVTSVQILRNRGGRKIAKVDIMDVTGLQKVKKALEDLSERIKRLKSPEALEAELKKQRKEAVWEAFKALKEGDFRLQTYNRLLIEAAEGISDEYEQHVKNKANLLMQAEFDVDKEIDARILEMLQTEPGMKISAKDGDKTYEINAKTLTLPIIYGDSTEAMLNRARPEFFEEVKQARNMSDEEWKKKIIANDKEIKAMKEGEAKEDAIKKKMKGYKEELEKDWERLTFSKKDAFNLSRPPYRKNEMALLFVNMSDKSVLEHKGLSYAIFDLGGTGNFVVYAQDDKGKLVRGTKDEADVPMRVSDTSVLGFALTRNKKGGFQVRKWSEKAALENKTKKDGEKKSNDETKKDEKKEQTGRLEACSTDLSKEVKPISPGKSGSVDLTVEQLLKQDAPLAKWSVGCTGTLDDKPVKGMWYLGGKLYGTEDNHGEPGKGKHQHRFCCADVSTQECKYLNLMTCMYVP